jgi:hypothetical protein
MVGGQPREIVQDTVSVISNNRTPTLQVQNPNPTKEKD